MKRYPLYILTFILILFSWKGFAQDGFYKKAEAFYGRFVVDGYVNYQKIKETPNGLIDLVELIKNQRVGELPPDSLKAFYINAYNLLVIDKVIKNYPVASVQNISGFFDTKDVKVGGETMSLNHFEKKVIFEKFPDSRLHFALVCAAASCPPLKSEAYSPVNLDRQLDKQTKHALKQDQILKLSEEEQKLKLSMIFKWYSQDFNPLDSFIIRHSDSDISDYTISYMEYDWSLNKYTESQTPPDPDEFLSNIRVFTPSALLSKDVFELKIFNNLYTQTRTFNSEGQITNDAGRSTYYGMFNSFLYGISDKLNLGFDLNVRSVQLNGPSDSPFEVLTFSQDSPENRTAVAKIGPKVKIAPFQSLPRLSIQSALWIPVSNDLEGKDSGDLPWLDWDTYTWLTQLFYDHSLSSDFQLFAAMEFFYRIPRQSFLEMSQLTTPVKVFLSYFPVNKISVYGMAEYGPTWGTGGEVISSFYTQTGVGAKYQMTKELELELLYTLFPLGKNQGAGQTFNFGLRYLH